LIVTVSFIQKEPLDLVFGPGQVHNKMPHDLTYAPNIAATIDLRQFLVVRNDVLFVIPIQFLI
jgi:hypothetical protein